MGTTYYLMNDLNMIGKEEHFVPYIYQKDRGWIVDEDNLLMDRVMGYDKSEPSGSIYRIGNSEMMEQVKEISEEEAIQFISSM